MKRQALFLIDGIHKPDNTVQAIRKLEKIYKVKAKRFVWIGGWEKVKSSESFSQIFEKEFKSSVIFSYEREGKPFPEKGIRMVLSEGGIQIVVQLSGAPQLNRLLTNKWASIAVSYGAEYIAGSTVFKAKRMKVKHKKPSLGLYATNKRVGKTAFSSYIAKLICGMKGVSTPWEPIIITHSRGGPASPPVLKIYKKDIRKSPDKLTRRGIFNSRFKPPYLERLLDFDLHGASDVFEDALVISKYLDEWECQGREVPVVSMVGCRRAGMGYFQEFVISNVEKGIDKANRIRGNFIIHEGSGAEHPPVSVDGNIFMIPSGVDFQLLEDFPGLEDSFLFIIANCQQESSSVKRVEEIEAFLRKKNSEAPVVWTQFIPGLIGSLEGIKSKRVMVLMTAPGEVLIKIKEWIESTYCCEVVSIANCLDDYEAMKESIDRTVKEKSPDLFLFEIKAQGVEGAKYVEKKYNMEYFYVNNIPREINKDFTIKENNDILDKAILSAFNKTIKRFNEREGKSFPVVQL